MEQTEEQIFGQSDSASLTEDEIFSTEEDTGSPFPPKNNEALRPDNIPAHAGNEILGSMEAVTSVATSLGRAAIEGLAAFNAVLGKGFEKVSGINLGAQSPEEAMESVRKAVPVFEPKTKFGKDTVVGLGDLLTNIDYYFKDGAEATVNKLNDIGKKAGLGGVNPEMDAFNKTALYTGINIIGLKEIGGALRSVGRVSRDAVESAIQSGIPKEVAEQSAVFSDIFHDLNKETAAFKKGPDNRPVPEVINDALQVSEELSLSTEGASWQEALGQKGLSIENSKESLAALKTTNPELVDTANSYAPKYRDVPGLDEGATNSLLQKFKETVTPPWFLQNRNPIVKKVFDLSRKEKLNIDTEVEDFLFGTGFKEGFLKTGKKEDIQVGVSTLRGSGTKMTEAGALYEWSSLGTKEKKQVINALVNLSDSRVVGVTPENTKDFNLSPQQYIAARKIPALFETLRARFNTTASLMGKEGIPDLKSLYLPRPVTGRWSLKIKEPGAESSVFHKGFDTEYQAKQFLKQNFDLKVLPKDSYTISPRARPGQKLDYEEIQLNNFVAFAKGSPDLDKSLSQFLEKSAINKSYVAARRSRRKAWSDGYDYDPSFSKNDDALVKAFEDAVLTQTRAMVRGTQRMVHDPILNELLSNPGVVQHYPNSVALGKKFREHAFGKRTEFNEGVNSLVDGMLVGLEKGSLGTISPKGAMATVNGFSKLVTTLSLLVFRPGYLAANTLAPYTVAPLNTKLMNSQGLVTGSVTKSIIQAEYDLHIKASPEIRDVMNYYVKDSKIARPGFFQQFSFSTDTHAGISKESLLEKTEELVSGRKLALRLDEYTRAKTGLIIYHQLRDAGISHKEAKEISAYQANHTMVDYSRQEKAPVFDNAITQVFGKFMPWGVNAMGQNLMVLRELNKQLANNPVKNSDAAKAISALAQAKAAETLIVGLGAGFGVAYIDKLMSMAGSNYTLTEKMQDTMPDWITYGVPQASTGTFLPSLGSPDIMGPNFLIPQTAIEMAQAVRGVWNEQVSLPGFYMKRVMGQFDPSLYPSKDEMGRLYKAFLPKSSHGFIDTWIASSDASGNGGEVGFWDLDNNTRYPLASTKHGGAVFSHVTKSGAMRKVLGGMDIEEHKELLNNLRDYRLNQKARNQYDALVRRLANFQEQGLDIPDAYIKTMEDLRVSHSKVKQDVKKEIEKGIAIGLYRGLASKRMSPDTVRNIERMYEREPKWADRIKEDVERTDFNVFEGIKKEQTEEEIFAE